MSTVAIGLYSNSFEVAHSCFTLLLALFKQFAKSVSMLEQTLKWFFNGETTEEQAKCGLKLSLYALKKHYEVASIVCELINIFCLVD